MPVRTARKASLKRITRSAQRFGLAAALVFIGCESLQNAVAEGDTRTISMHHLHTGEKLTITYKRNGRYDDEALKKLNHLLRDWRKNEEVVMDPRLIDLVWEAQRELGAKEAIQIICGYRAPATNAMLRRRSSGVARFSQHTLGKAIDFYIPGVPLNELRTVGLRMQRGGVGFYPTSGSPFVHLDIGSVRHWPRMTREQLAKVFPDGRTVHVPTDGHPMANYALALADIEKRGSEPSTLSLAAARNDGVSTTDKRGLLAKLFGFGKNQKNQDEAEDADETAAIKPAVTRGKPVRTETAPVAVAAATPAPVAPVPLPKVRPEMQTPVKVTTVAARPETRPEAATASGFKLAAAEQPKNIFDARGYWQGAPQSAANMPTSTTLQLAAAKRQNEIQREAAPIKWPGNETVDRVPGEIALAYAAQAEVTATTPPQNPMGSAGSKIADAGATIAVKSSGDRPSALQTIPARSTAIASVQRSDDPWLRALVVAPSLQAFMTTTLLGEPDYRALRPLLERPSSTVVMTFSEDPHHGMSADNFSGTAVIFLATATFSRQTAFLR